MQKVLSPAFFRRPVLTVAEELIGKTLMRKRGGEKIALIITEVEAYDGVNDRACHAHRGRTARNDVMFGPAGYFYVYFIYGMYFMLNIVTGEEGSPAAVLVRGAFEMACPESDHQLLQGPGKLTKALGIDRALNGKRSHPSSNLWIEDRGITIPKKSIHRTPRIGVAYAGASAELPYRFVLDPNTLAICSR